MEKLLDQAKLGKNPGDKSKLAQIFEKAKELSEKYHKEFFKCVLSSLPDAMKKNPKIKEFLKEKEINFQFRDS